MNGFLSDSRLDALFQAARVQRPDTTQAEYAFETRLSARLRVQHEASTTWARVSWRMAPLFGAFVFGLILLEAQVSNSAQEAAQIAAVDQPDAGELWSN